MKYAAILFPLSVLLTVVLLSVAYLQVFAWPTLLAPVALGVIWVAGHQLKRFWVRHLAFVGFLMLVVIAGSRGLNAALTLAGLLTSLMAWNLAGFVQRMRAASRIEGAARLERMYLLRLGLVLFVGGVLAGLALTVRITLNFGVAFFLAILVVIGASQAVSHLRRESD